MLILEIKVSPQSGRQEWLLDKTGRLKCFLKSPPERNRANQELIDLIADNLGIARALITIIAGATSRTKRVKIDYPITLPALLAKLGITIQQNLF